MFLTLSSHVWYVMHKFLEKLPCVVKRTAASAGITVNKGGEKITFVLPRWVPIQATYLSAQILAHWSKVLPVMWVRLAF